MFAGLKLLFSYEIRSSRFCLRVATLKVLKLVKAHLSTNRFMHPTIPIHLYAGACAAVSTPQDLQKMFNFHKKDLSWKVPIIKFKDKILDIVGGENISPLLLTSQFNLVYLSR